MKRFLSLAGALFLFACTARAQWTDNQQAWFDFSGGTPIPSGYLTIQKNGVDQPQENVLNLVEGTNVTITCADTPNTKTSCTFAATGGGGSTPTGTGFVHVTGGVQDGAAKTVDTADITNNAVTYGKMQAASAASRFIASNSTGTAITEVAPGCGITIGTFGPGGSQAVQFNPLTCVEMHDDFPSAGASNNNAGGSLPWQYIATNTPGNFLRGGEQGHPGFTTYVLGTGGNSVQMLRFDPSSMLPEVGSLTTWVVRIDNLSGGGNNYKFGCGWGDNSADPTSVTDGILFIYDQASSVNWRIVVRSNSSGAATSSNSAVSTATWYTLQIWVENSTTTHFYVNGTELNVSPFSGTVPAGSTRVTAPACGYVQTLGTTASVFDLDFFGLLMPVTR